MGLDRLLIYCVDVGSVRTGKFGWARIDADTNELRESSDIAELSAAVAGDLNDTRPVALGFECPLFVPLPKAPDALGASRPNEGNRAWSAGAGAGSLAIGLAEVPWILRSVAHAVAGVESYLDWDDFRKAGSGLFVWEAFVTAQAKGSTHIEDATFGARSFRDVLAHPVRHNALGSSEDVLSLIGAALLATGWTEDHAVVRTPCLVIRAEAKGSVEDLKR